MKVIVQYSDLDSFTREEAVDRVKHLFGKSASIEVTPDTFSVEDTLRFVLTQLIGYDQLCLLNDEPYEYKEKIKILKKQILSKIESQLNSVILSNETKFNGD